MSIWRTNPFVAVTAVVALAMGIGFTTTMFSIVHGATRPLPFPEADEIVAVEKLAVTHGGNGQTRRFDLVSWQAARTLEAVGAYESISASLSSGGDEPERISGAALTPNTFALLGQHAALGRVFSSDDAAPGASPVVVLSHRLWQRRFNAHPAVLGTRVRLAGVDHVVIGVMPAGFGFPVSATYWVPLAEAATAEPGTGPPLQVFGRLADGVSLDTASAELSTLTAAAYARESGPAPRVRTIPFQDVETPREVIRGLYLLLVGVSFVLLIACANVANLLIARAALRARDMALRLALGATRAQIVRAQMWEAATLAAAAAAIGLALAYAGTRVFAINTAHIIEAFWVDFRIDLTVALFASGLAGIATLAAGLLPALRATRSNVADVLRDRMLGSSGLTIGRISRASIGAQVSLACGLLALTMVLARAAVSIHAVAWPFDPHAILTFEFELPEATLTEVVPRTERLTAIALALNATPGVDAAALTTALPGRGGGSSVVSLDAPPAANTSARTAVSLVSPEFFEVTRGRALAGRVLQWTDDERSNPVAVVNESFVRSFSPESNPVGRRLFLGTRALTIVGVVPDMMAGDVQERRQDGVYLSIVQSRPYGIRVMVRGQGDPAALLPGIRTMLRRVEPELPLTDVFTLHEAVYRDKRILEVLSSLFLLFGGGALVLTAIGLYGVVAFAVAVRTRELGIRLALGASRRQILGAAVGPGGRQLVGGLAIGLLIAAALGRGFAAAVDQLTPPDLTLLIWVAAIVLMTAAVSLVVPARRALRLHVLSALRQDA